MVGPVTTGWEVHNPEGKKRVVVTKILPGTLWLDLLKEADCRVEICQSQKILTKTEIKDKIGDKCDAVMGQLTEAWDEELFEHLKKAGGVAYTNVAVGFNNVNIAAANKHGIPVGNTPGVLTETTAEMAVALTFAAGRRTGEAERFMRAGKYEGWLMTLFLGKLFWRKTLGIIGCGRIGATYAKMMAEGHKMNIVYFDLYQNKDLENYVADYGNFLKSHGEEPITITKLDTVEDVLKQADVVSLHTLLDDTTKHMINEKTLNLMKKDALLINTARGPCIDEKALVAHLNANPDFRCGLDVFEKEPAMEPGLTECENAVVVPHIASATTWTREGMATIAARNIVGILEKVPAYNKPDVVKFLEPSNKDKSPPSVVNAKDVDYPVA